MCPVCVANMALIAVGATSSGGLTAFAMNKFRKRKQTNEIKGGQNETGKDEIRNRIEPNESSENRVTAGVGGCAPATAREGEGVDPRPRRTGRRASADAVAGRGEGVRVRRAQGQGEPARPVRRPPSADRLPRLLRTRRARLAGPCLRRLLHGG